MDKSYEQYLKEEWSAWYLTQFFSDNPACLDTPRNRELLLAGCYFLRVAVTSENLTLVYSSLRQRNDVPLEIDPNQPERSQAFMSCFPTLRDTAVENIYQQAPTFRILMQKQEAERILAAKMQREADAVDAPAVQGVWVSGAYYTDLSTIPQGPAELAGMSRANQTALDELGQRQLSRNLAVRNGNLD